MWAKHCVYIILCPPSPDLDRWLQASLMNTTSEGKISLNTFYQDSRLFYGDINIGYKEALQTIRDGCNVDVFQGHSWFAMHLILCSYSLVYDTWQHMEELRLCFLMEIALNPVWKVYLTFKNGLRKLSGQMHKKSKKNKCVFPKVIARKKIVLFEFTPVQHRFISILFNFDLEECQHQWWLCYHSATHLKKFTDV